MNPLSNEELSEIYSFLRYSGDIHIGSNKSQNSYKSSEVKRFEMCEYKTENNLRIIDREGIDGRTIVYYYCRRYGERVVAYKIFSYLRGPEGIEMHNYPVALCAF